MKIILFPFVLLHAILQAIAAIITVPIGKLLLALGMEAMAFYTERQLRTCLTLFFLDFSCETSLQIDSDIRKPIVNSSIPTVGLLPHHPY